MSNISIKVNLRQLQHYITTTAQGNEVIVIPTKQNSLFVTEKGIYLDITAFELKDKKTDSKDTHILKQALPKEEYAKLTDEQKKAMPILGNAIVWSQTHQEPEPKGETIPDFPLPDNDDLPF